MQPECCNAAQITWKTARMVKSVGLHGQLPDWGCKLFALMYVLYLLFL